MRCIMYKYYLIYNDMHTFVIGLMTYGLDKLEVEHSHINLWNKWQISSIIDIETICSNYTRCAYPR